MTVEIKIGLAIGFDIDHAIESITDSLYYSSNVTQYEYDLIYHILNEIKSVTLSQSTEIKNISHDKRTNN
jgi:hypothetical protein